MFEIPDDNAPEQLAERIEERSKVHVAVRSATISREDATKIAHRIQGLVTAEVLSIESQRLGEGAGDLGAGLAELAEAKRGQASLQGLPLGNSVIEGLSDKLRKLAHSLTPSEHWPAVDCCDRPPPSQLKVDGEGQALPPPPPPAPQTEPLGTISQALDEPGCICIARNIPGADAFPLRKFVPPPTHSGKSYVVAFYFRLSADVMRIVVTEAGLPADRAIITLVNGVDWAKEIVAWNLCNGAIARVFSPSRNSTASMEIVRHCDHGADTLVFRKPGFLGFWFDVAHFESDLFWDAFGGREVEFTWLWD